MVGSRAGMQFQVGEGLLTWIQHNRADGASVTAHVPPAPPRAMWVRLARQPPEDDSCTYPMGLLWTLSGLVYGVHFKWMLPTVSETVPLEIPCCLPHPSFALFSSCIIIDVCILKKSTAETKHQCKVWGWQQFPRGMLMSRVGVKEPGAHPTPRPTLHPAVHSLTL